MVRNRSLRPGRVEDAVQRDGQLDHAEVRAEVSAGLGQPADQLLPDFSGKLLQLRQREFLHVFRSVDHVEISAHVFVKRYIVELLNRESLRRGFRCNELRFTIQLLFQRVSI
jgi:hypothetical protein